MDCNKDGTRERVTGPFNGYYIAALGCYIGGAGLGFRGYYKICREDPHSYWAADWPIAQGRCGPQASSALGALRMAESAASCQLQGMVETRAAEPTETAAVPTAERRDL